MAAHRGLKGVPQLKRRMHMTLTRVIPQKAEKAAMAAAVTGAAIASTYAPVERGFLSGSQYRKPIQISGTAYVGAVGYTAEYAAAVHDAKGTLRGQPRPSGRGNYWDPDAQPGFLTKAFDDHRDDIDQVVYKAMKI